MAFRHVVASAGSRRHLFEYVPCTLGSIAKHEQHVKSRYGGQESFRKKNQAAFHFLTKLGLRLENTLVVHFNHIFCESYIHRLFFENRFIERILSKDRLPSLQPSAPNSQQALLK